jgi:hypothetical protein
MVSEDLCRLVQLLEEKSGASFTRIMTASLLSYLFDAFKNPAKGKGKAPDPDWMRWAILVERGEVTIGDLPLAMLDNFIETAELLTRSKDADGKPSLGTKDFIENLTSQLKDVKTIRRGWQNRIEDFGGTMEALIQSLESRWVK